jgi:SH3-like domain-containing protein
LIVAAVALAGVSQGALAQDAKKPAPAAKAAPAPKAAPASPTTAPTAADVDDDAKETEAKETDSKDGKENAGLPIPRFVSLRTNPINMRTGPGVRYPVDWVYQRRHLPVEVVAEFDTWRRIRDPDGTEGWVHQSMITGRRTAVVKGGTQTLRRTNADTAEKVADLEKGVIVNVQRCPAGPFCRVEVNGLQGWLRRDQIWGVYPDETVE